MAHVLNILLLAIALTLSTLSTLLSYTVAIELRKFDWKPLGKTLPEAMLAIFQQTGHPAHDPGTGLTFRRLDLKRALDLVWG